MASSPIYHTRSISLPSRSHPVVEQLDQQLCRLRSSQAATTSSSVSNSLNGLKDLYASVDELLQLPLNQQALSQDQQAKWVDEVLDGSLRLLDICSASRDALQQSRERLQDIQSALRRRCSGELTINSEAVEYLNTRKSVKKAMKKCLKSVKTVSEQNDESHAAVSMLKDVQAITADTFKTLSYIAGAKTQSQKSKWSVVAKLISKNTKKETETSSKFEEVDATLNSLISQKKNGVNASQIIDLESEIQDLDEALECLFRHLVKTRATLLNIFSF